MRHEPSEEEAIQLIKNFPDKDAYIDSHLVMSWINDEPRDNSIELDRYWKLCKSIAEHGIDID